MYLEHYGLNEPPFRITPHTDFFFSGANRGATLEALLYAITHDEGIVKISGEVGSGKTMLCRVLMERLPENVVIVYLANPSLSREDILYALADELGIEVEGSTRASTVMRALQQKLLELYAEGKQVVVLIDEAHAMPKETLEEIRLLSNLESNRHKLLQLVLFGQPEINEILGRADMRQLRERITQSFNLEPLVRDDIAEYIDFRMRAAGYRGPSVFNADAIKQIDRVSQGLTRRINILADKALLSSFATGVHQVGVKEAREAIRDSEFAASTSQRSARQRLTGPLWAIGGGALALATVALWQVFLRPPATDQHREITAATPGAMQAGQIRPAQLPPPAASIPAPPTPSPALESALPPLQVAPASDPPAKGTEKKSPPTPLLNKLMASSRLWLESAANDRWFLQIITASSDHPDHVEIFLRRNSELAKDSKPLRVYQNTVGGVGRYGVIWGDYASRKDAVNDLNTLPAELKRHHPYPRQVIRLRPNSNTENKDL